MIAIRRAVPEDARALAEVHVAGWQAAYRGIVPDAMLDALAVDEREARWRRWLTASGPGALRAWRCERDGAIDGVAATGPSPDPDDDPARTGALLLIYLLPAAWGQGRGRALLAAALDDAQARGWRDLTLWVLEANARARAFYARAGFAADGARKLVELGGASLAELRYRRPLGDDR